MAPLYRASRLIVLLLTWCAAGGLLYAYDEQYNNRTEVVEYGYGSGGPSPALVASFTNDYDLARPAAHTDYNNKATSYAHADSLNRLTEISRADDSRGRLWKVTPPYRGSAPGDTVSEYDGTNRLVRVSEPDGAATATLYQDNQATVTDPAGKARRTEADALGRVASVTEDPSGLNYGTAYGYDALDNLTAVTQGSQARTFVYDLLGRLRRAANPESGTVTYGYDDSGNLASRLDGRNVSTTLAYDGLNRVTQKSYSDATPAVTFTYDNCANGQGRLCGVSNSASATAYEYNALGRVSASTQTTAARAYRLEYAYNLAGGLKKLVYPSGRQVTYSFDQAGRASAVGGYATGIEYAPHGAVSQMTLGNGVVETRTHNVRLQPVAIAAVKDAATLLSLTNSYGTANNNGNVQSQAIQPLGVTQAYLYDGVNRVQSVTEGSLSRTYGYDRYGNGAGEDIADLLPKASCFSCVVPFCRMAERAPASRGGLLDFRFAMLPQHRPGWRSAVHGDC